LIQGARDLLQDPGRIVRLLRSLLQAALSGVARLGAALATHLMQLFERPDDQLGEAVGRTVGDLLVQALLTYFTAGTATAASAISRVVSILGRVGRNIVAVLRRLGGLFRRVLRFLGNLGRRFRSAGSRAAGILGRIGAFFRRIGAWFRRMIRRLRRRGRRGRRGRGGRRNRQWRRFVGAMRRLGRQHARRGITRTALESRARLYRGRNRAGVASVRVSRRPARRRPEWTVTARKRRGLWRRFRILVDARLRWRLGRREIRRQVRRFRRRGTGSGVLERILGPIRRRFVYGQLRVVRDDREHDWNIVGQMNPDGEVEEVPQEIHLDPPTARKVGNEVHLRVQLPSQRANRRRIRNQRLRFSLQRHSYRHLHNYGQDTEQPRNSIYYRSVRNPEIMADSVALGRALQDRMLDRFARSRAADIRPSRILPSSYRVPSNRRFLVDNAAHEREKPDHFFVSTGNRVYGAIGSPSWNAARRLRRAHHTHGAQLPRLTMGNDLEGKTRIPEMLVGMRRRGSPNRAVGRDFRACTGFQRSRLFEAIDFQLLRQGERTRRRNEWVFERFLRFTEGGEEELQNNLHEVGLPRRAKDRILQPIQAAYRAIRASAQAEPRSRAQLIGTGTAAGLPVTRTRRMFDRFVEIGDLVETEEGGRWRWG
ncbi:MAG: hypothetical protein MI919_41360, partial [Holophagales bacterium]|nr:hypothetical protein [Holophagales bacterium]